MSRRKISQREARRLRKRVAELEQRESDRRNAWVRDWPGGVDLGSGLAVHASWWWCVQTARKLGSAVVAIPVDGDKLKLFAVKL